MGIDGHSDTHQFSESDLEQKAERRMCEVVDRLKKRAQWIIIGTSLLACVIAFGGAYSTYLQMRATAYKEMFALLNDIESTRAKLVDARSKVDEVQSLAEQALAEASVYKAEYSVLASQAADLEDGVAVALASAQDSLASVLSVESRYRDLETATADLQANLTYAIVDARETTASIAREYDNLSASYESIAPDSAVIQEFADRLQVLESSNTAVLEQLTTVGNVADRFVRLESDISTLFDESGIRRKVPGVQ